jgi:D-alanine-D-alanine ligase
MAMNSSTQELTNLRTQYGKIGVLMGGPSSEREISLKSGKAIYESLKEQGIDTVGIDIKSDDKDENIRFIKSYKIDCAFLALHGRFGEDGTIQEILDNLEIPYTGSGKLASRLAMDKIATRKILEDYGLPVPKYTVLGKLSYQADRESPNNHFFPLVVKPATHGSSIGLSIVEKRQDLEEALDLAFRFDERILVEEYIKGREVTVGILDEETLPVIEIIPKKKFFDYEAKYQPGLTDYVVPARLDNDIIRKIQSVALKAHKLLGCYGCSRVDMILSNDNIPYVLELNTIPGFTPTSLLPKAAKAMGIEFAQLCLRLIQLAYEKT